MMMKLITCCALLVGASSATQMKDYPMLMAHDAATAYLDESSIIVEKQILDFAKTQPSGGFKKLLDCGVRALDVRPSMAKGQVVMHHGIINVDTTLEQGLVDVQAWSSSNPQDLILIYLSHFDGDQTKSQTKELLQKLGITFFEENALAEMSYEDALSAGPVIAQIDSVDENWDSTVVCEKSVFSQRNLRGLSFVDKYLCFDPKTKQIPLDHIGQYMMQTTASPSHNARLWMAQGHWQYDTESVALGIAHGSSILQDNSKSGINQLLAQNVTKGLFPAINFLEIDNACDGGLALAQALANWHQQRQ